MKAKQLIIVLVILMASSRTSIAKITYEKRSYETKLIGTEAPMIDGILNDAIWQKGVWQGGFIQREPHAGKDPSQKTEFQIIYDHDFLYVGIKAFDNSPDSVSYRISRRDDTDGDAVGLAIDSYHDQKTAFGFWVNAAGVKKDFILADDGNNQDLNWDPIWWVKTAKTNDGWSAEMKIPLNQLRFATLNDLTWGLQVGRFFFRKQESSYWQFIPKDASGWVSEFGEINGLRSLTPRRQVEFAPYIVTKTERFKNEVGNPFMTGKRNGLNAGIDAKVGITNNFTLDLTINPDFGQVEADPSVVNLSAFETYFPEKRPFFVAGSNLFSFNLVAGDGDQAAENLFYSRRIGRSPQISPDLAKKEFIDIPSNTAILGAAKISGRNNNGLSVGIMESLTSNSYAKIDSLGKRRRQLVEPLTNYFVGTLKKEFNKGNTIINSIITSTNRQLTDASKDYLHKDAFTGGIDFQQYWKNRVYFFSTKLYFSNVNGTKEAIAATQTAPARYFQRPDVRYVRVDSSRTSLTGTGGLIQFGKFGEGHVRYMTFVSWKSPELEVNDIGYSQNVDDIFQVAWVGLRYWEPVFIFRNININFNQWTGWDFGGISAYKGGNVNFNLQFTNYWSFGTGVNRNGMSLSSSSLRGGPMLKREGNWNNWYNIESDQRKALTISIGGSNNWGDNNSNIYHSYFGSISYRPSKNLSISIAPEISKSNSKIQYVTNTNWNGDPRYINASISEKSYDLSFRLEYSINPELTVQYWGRPYLTSGRYTDYKMITNPRAKKFTDRFYVYQPSQLTYNATDNEYHVDENNDGTNDYTFPKMDFNFLDFQSNMIVRWEYRPGSTLFFVWTMGKQDYYDSYSTSTGSDINNLFDTHPHSIFLVKFSYRFN
ncbi:MAG: carbohydrate binding family 9 domain-containing protein [Bacteroidales bacterium]|nr:carbohydrate binding family 9 domain-containing protein [Bacteroidales bacterium]